MSGQVFPTLFNYAIGWVGSKARRNFMNVKIIQCAPSTDFEFADALACMSNRWSTLQQIPFEAAAIEREMDVFLTPFKNVPWS